MLIEYVVFIPFHGTAQSVEFFSTQVPLTPLHAMAPIRSPRKRYIHALTTSFTIHAVLKILSSAFIACSSFQRSRAFSFHLIAAYAVMQTFQPLTHTLYSSFAVFSFSHLCNYTIDRSKRFNIYKQTKKC